MAVLSFNVSVGVIPNLNATFPILEDKSLTGRKLEINENRAH